MPRKLPTSANDQFRLTLLEFETACIRLGQYTPFSEDPEDQIEKRVGTMRNKLIKLFENRGA
jgi:hypothetical protein